MERGQERARRPRRRFVVGIGVALIVGLVAVALANSLRSFGLSIDIAEIVPSGKTVSVPGRCDAAVETAWAADSKTPLWAVTVGTNMMGYTPVFGSEVKYVLLGDHEIVPAALCRGEARHRLLVSGWLLLGALAVGVLTVVLARRAGRDGRAATPRLASPSGRGT